MQMDGWMCVCGWVGGCIVITDRLQRHVGGMHNKVKR